MKKERKRYKDERKRNIEDKGSTKWEVKQNTKIQHQQCKQKMWKKEFIGKIANRQNVQKWVCKERKKERKKERVDVFLEMLLGWHILNFVKAIVPSEKGVEGNLSHKNDRKGNNKSV